MRIIRVIILSLFCFLLCSCQKDPQDLLTGTWEVTWKSTYINGNAATTINSSFYCVFEENGEGMFTSSLKTSAEHQVDVVSSPYYLTYFYDKENSTIVFEHISGQDKFSWIVDNLTSSSFTCHTSSDISSTTYYGKKMK